MEVEEDEVEEDEDEEPKEVIATKVTGTVKWFNVKSGYGFINRNDTKEDVFGKSTRFIPIERRLFCLLSESFS